MNTIARVYKKPNSEESEGLKLGIKLADMLNE